MIISKIVRCSRCGEDHDNLDFTEFERPVAPIELDFEWTHWASCPTNGDPILLVVVEDTDPTIPVYPGDTLLTVQE